MLRTRSIRIRHSQGSGMSRPVHLTAALSAAVIRLVISDKSKAPGIIVKGKEYPHPDRKSAGMIFYNDEGTENGGLIFGGDRSEDGTKHSSGHLSFDAYEQDQAMALDSTQSGGERHIRVILTPIHYRSNVLACQSPNPRSPRKDKSLFPPKCARNSASAQDPCSSGTTSTATSL